MPGFRDIILHASTCDECRQDTALNILIGALTNEGYSENYIRNICNTISERVTAIHS